MRNYAHFRTADRRPVERPLWDALRRTSQPTSARDLHLAIDAHPNAIQLRLQIWRRAGLVIAFKGRPFRYAMTDKALNLPAPPAIRPNGKPATPKDGRSRMWAAIRILKRFDLPSLLMSSEVSRRSAEDYVNCLLRAGILVRSQRGNSMRGDWSVYALAAPAGPRAPIVRHGHRATGRYREVFDPNSGATIDISPVRRAAAPEAGGVG